jgi:hypothetical protein
MNLELVTNLLQRNVPDFVSDQVQFWVDMAQEAIRRDEREKIVAWLRKQATCGCGRSDCIADIYPNSHAEGIETGKHLT